MQSPNYFFLVIQLNLIIGVTIQDYSNTLVSLDTFSIKFNSCIFDIPITHTEQENEMSMHFNGRKMEMSSDSEGQQIHQTQG